jgi:hypothetical protein
MFLFNFMIIMVRTHFHQHFFKTLFDFSKMDKNKCPKLKTQNTFWKFFVTESFDFMNCFILLSLLVTI